MQQNQHKINMHSFDNGLSNVLFMQIVHDVVLLHGKREEPGKNVFASIFGFSSLAWNIYCNRLIADILPPEAKLYQQISDCLLLISEGRVGYCGPAYPFCSENQIVAVKSSGFPSVADSGNGSCMCILPCSRRQAVPIHDLGAPDCSSCGIPLWWRVICFQRHKTPFCHLFQWKTARFRWDFAGRTISTW